MSKPLHGAKFDTFCQQTMRLPVAAQLMMAFLAGILSLSFVSPFQKGSCS